MNGTQRLFTTRKIFPDLVRSKHQEGSEQSRQTVGDPVENCLRRTPRKISWREGIQAILHDVEIARRQSDRGKVVECVVNQVELVRLISLQDLIHHSVKLCQCPAINLLHLLHSYSVSRRVEAIQIAQSEAR